MARTQIDEYGGVAIWISASETYAWAHRTHAAWPCSQLSGHRVFAAFDRNGLCDMAVDGRSRDVDATEFNALVSDHLRPKRPTDHPVYFVAVGQFDW